MNTRIELFKDRNVVINYIKETDEISMRRIDGGTIYLNFFLLENIVDKARIEHIRRNNEKVKE